MSSGRVWLYPVLVVFSASIAAIVHYGDQRFQTRITSPAQTEASRWYARSGGA